MAGMAAKLVAGFFESRDIKVNVMEDNIFRIGWSFNGGTLDIYFSFDETDTHVHLEGMNFIKVTEDKFDKMYKVLNECNFKYSHVKFVLDPSDGLISARDDALIQLDTCGAECFELMIRMLRIVEDAYPTFMKAMWA
jgi:hypothetical protein